MGLTYETRDSNERLENFEWDRIWVQNARDTATSRLVMIGDSITLGIMETLNDHIRWQWPADSYTSSKALDNPNLIPTMRLYLTQEPRRTAIVFNNGLHGWHLNDSTEYAEYYEQTVAFLQKEFPDSPLFLSLCTYLRNEERNERVLARNKVIRTVAEKFGLPVIDLYTVTKNNADLLARDGVHFSNYRPLCQEVMNHVEHLM